MPSRSKRPHRPPSSPPAGQPEGERLQKVLAAAGFGSRRECEELIVSGRVEVDRQVVTELGTRVDPENQEIRIDGEPVKLRRRLYFAVNKPPGILSTSRDPSGRPRVIDLIPSDQRLFTVGRLDKSSEGLILVTNDGDLANKLTHPRYGVEKTYLVQVAGELEPEVLERLRKGIHLADGVARVKRVQIKRHHKQSTLLEMVLDEGQNREIRRILARVGHKVQWLRRVAVGPVRLGDLPPGDWRRLSADEVESLRAAARGGGQGPAPRRKRPAGKRPSRVAARAERPAAAPKRPAGIPAHVYGKQPPRGGKPTGKRPSPRRSPSHRP